ncbi:thiol methyltransferase [Podospora australis]|uniref:Thiol methyltransferase n=1 Tax=Podospora australis TaxID=1536484 RepID=A0AAN7AM72_9PEZI|nr:thiol methyltransferase [Podospora australis]
MPSPPLPKQDQNHIQGHNHLYDNPGNPNRLVSTFSSEPPSAHPQKWDSLWQNSYTPWDRGTYSQALSDYLTSPSSPFPPSGKKALVPGCGRGYDVLLLSSLGFDVVGLDFSSTSLDKAKENQLTAGKEGVGLKEKRTVTWVQGDFFGDDFLKEVGVERFDLIFDYTFFVALPPDMRPRWAKRMSELLSRPEGRLICLEWPLRRDPAAGGPPWGVTAETYEAHLLRPGEEVEYDERGYAVLPADKKPSEMGLKRLARFQPARTHPAGYDEEGRMMDYLSVWGHV